MSSHPQVRFLTSAQVHSAVLASLPAVRLHSVSAVTFIPRGGAIPAVLLAQHLDVPLLSLAEARPERHVLLVDDLVVSGRSMAFAVAQWPADRSPVTYALIHVPHGTTTGLWPDVVAITTAPGRYVMVPWEITDALEDDFPLRCVFDLDGVFRDPATRLPLLSAHRPIPGLLSFRGNAEEEQGWLGRHGYRADQLVVLPNGNDADALSAHLDSMGAEVYVTGDAARARAVKARNPDRHVAVFPDFISVE